jgi:segregation and condensation protein B
VTDPLEEIEEALASDEELLAALEAVLLVVDTPAPTDQLADVLGQPIPRVKDALDGLAAEYTERNRGMELRATGEGWRLYSRDRFAPYVERFVLDGQSARMSSAALETLAIVAYKQPISRAQLASIRGVNADGVMRTLEARGYVHEVARDPGPGNAVMYGTTPAFLEKLGLDSVDQLPPLGAFVPGADVVEQLERTLRVDPTPSADGADEAATDMTDEADRADDADLADEADLADLAEEAEDADDHVVVDIRSNGSHAVDLVDVEADEPAIDLEDADAGERHPGEP